MRGVLDLNTQIGSNVMKTMHVMPECDNVVDRTIGRLAVNYTLTLIKDLSLKRARNKYVIMKRTAICRSSTGVDLF